MFLTKKTAILTNKPKNTDNSKPKKALAGLIQFIKVGEMTMSHSIQPRNLLLSQLIYIKLRIKNSFLKIQNSKTI